MIVGLQTDRAAEEIIFAQNDRSRAPSAHLHRPTPSQTAAGKTMIVLDFARFRVLRVTDMGSAQARP